LGYYVDEKGKKHKRTASRSDFAKKKDAIEYLPKLRHEEKQKDITIMQLYDLWRKTHYRTIGKSKQSSYKTVYKKN